MLDRARIVRDRLRSRFLQSLSFRYQFRRRGHHDRRDGILASTYLETPRVARTTRAVMDMAVGTRASGLLDLGPVLN